MLWIQTSLEYIDKNISAKLIHITIPGALSERGVHDRILDNTCPAIANTVYQRDYLGLEMREPNPLNSSSL